MSSREYSGSWIGWALTASSLLSSGCLLPYAYPHLSVVPPFSVEAKGAEVHAFRVDGTTDVADVGESCTCSLSRMRLTEGGSSFLQARLTLDYGCYVAAGALNYPVHRGHSTRVRLYRPGHHLIEAAEWMSPEPVVWKPATDLAAQEKALDALIAPPGAPLRFRFLAEKSGWSAQALSAGSSSAGHREALLFAAAEYERLAKLPGANCPSLERKAEELRKRAAE